MSKSIIEKLGITPGPWKWYGWFAKGCRNTMDLTTTHSGRLYIMDFVRAGTRGALPRFRKNLDDNHVIMERCDKFGEEMDHNGEYTMTEPNAMVIAAAPEMLEALILEAIDSEQRMGWKPDRYTIKIIEKATGKSWDEIKEMIK